MSERYNGPDRGEGSDEVERAPEIKRELQLLSEEVGYLTTNVDDLMQRAEPALCPPAIDERMDAGGAEPKEVEPRTSIGQAIRSARVQVERATRSLRDMQRRIEI